MEKLYLNIKNRRIELGMTQKELAEKMGYSDRSSIAKIESGAVDINQSKIMQFAKALQTTPGKLMGAVDVPETHADDHPQEYYENPIVQDMTDKLRTNPKYGALFRASANVKPEDIDFVTQLIEKMSD